MTRTRWMALFFALGSLCFLIGPFPGYVSLVGASADGVTFFIGSILFTIGGALQCVLAWPSRATRGAGRPGWWSAVIQSAGTLFFNVTTFQAMQTAVSNPQYDRLVWRPDAFGSVCFLISGAIAYRASARHGWLPAREGPDWWQPGVNLLGCIFFGISAVAGYVVPSSGSVLDLAAANWNTCLGAACFLASAVAALFTGCFVGCAVWSGPRSKRCDRWHEFGSPGGRDVSAEAPRIACGQPSGIHLRRCPLESAMLRLLVPTSSPLPNLPPGRRDARFQRPDLTVASGWTVPCSDRSVARTPGCDRRRERRTTTTRVAFSDEYLGGSDT